MNTIQIQRYSFRRFIVLLSCLFFLISMIYSVSESLGKKYENEYAKRVEINIQSHSGDQGNRIKYGDIDQLREFYSSEGVSYMYEKNAFIVAGNEGCTARAVLSGENLNKFLGMNINKGTFFSNNQHRYGRKVVVISETLAYQLFGTFNVLGNEIDLFENNYKIIGLYKKGNSILSLLTSDNTERIYIPFESYSTGTDSNSLDTVFIKAENLEKEPFREIKIEDILKKQLNINTELYRINDYYNSDILMSQPLSAFIFLTGILIIFSVVKYFLYFVNLYFSDFKENMKNRYFFENLKASKIKLALFSIVILMMIMLILAILWAIRFKGNISYEYVPVDNIFDFKFYAGKIREAIIESNYSLSEYIPTQLELDFRNNLYIIYALMFCLIINFVSALSAIKLNKLISISFVKQFIGLAVSALIGLLAAGLLCLSCGIAFSFRILDAVVMGLLICILFIDNARETGRS